MFNMKLLLIVLLATYAHGQTLSIEENVRIALEELKTIIESSVQLSDQTFQSKLSQLVTYADEIKVNTVNKNDKTVVRVLEDINELSALAKQMGINIAKCIGDHELEIRNIPERANEETHVCVTDKLHLAETIVSDALVSISGNFKHYTTLSAELTACGSGNGAVPCQSQVLSKITILNTELPQKLTKEIQEATTKIGNLHTSTFACGVLKSTEVTLETSKIFSEITTCVHDLIEAPMKQLVL